MRFTPFAIGAALLAAAQPALAACSADRCTDVKIILLYVDGNGSGYLSTSGTETGLSCTPDSSVFIRINPAGSQSAWLFSALMTAYVTNQTVTVRTDNSGGNCTAVYMTMGSL